MMMRPTCGVIAALCAGLLGVENCVAEEFAQAPRVTKVAAAQDGATKPNDKGGSGFITDSMKLVFEDNFDGTSLDLTKWFPGRSRMAANGAARTS